jgi:hypothetical protein
MPSCIDRYQSLAALHQIVLEPSCFLTIVRREAHGGRHATIGDVYERDEQLEVHLQ